MDEDSKLEYIKRSLQDDDPDIPRLDDLPYWWKRFSGYPPKSENQRYPNALDFLWMYIHQADIRPWARQGLRNLVEYLHEEEEDIPDPLKEWVLEQYIRDDPPPKRGRPELHDRNYRVWAAYRFFRERGLTRQAAIAQISDLRSTEKGKCDTETVRSIIRKFEKHMRETRPRY